jgi:hypothetical protein
MYLRSPLYMLKYENTEENVSEGHHTS